jgi:hypothetical protein
MTILVILAALALAGGAVAVYVSAFDAAGWHAPEQGG